MSKASRQISERIAFLQNVSGLQKVNQEIDFGSGVTRIIASGECAAPIMTTNARASLTIAIRISWDGSAPIK